MRNMHIDFRITIVLLIFVHSRESENSNGHINNKLEENHCASNPCENGGTCTNSEDTYSCACPDFYEGRHCSRNTWCERLGKDECGNEMCEYNAMMGRGECICEDDKIFNRTTKTCIVNQLNKNIIAVVGGVIGTLLTIAVIVVVILCKEKRKNKEEEDCRQKMIFSKDTTLVNKQDDHSKDIELLDNNSVAGLVSQHSDQHRREFEDDLMITRNPISKGTNEYLCGRNMDSVLEMSSL